MAKWSNDSVMDAALDKIATGVTAFNAVWAVVLATVLYLALRPALKKAGLFHEM